MTTRPYVKGKLHIQNVFLFRKITYDDRKEKSILLLLLLLLSQKQKFFRENVKRNFYLLLHI